MVCPFLSSGISFFSFISFLYSFPSDLTWAGRYSSLIYATGLIVSPLVGWTIGRFGHIVTLLFGGASSFAAGCLTLALSDFHPALGLVLIGAGLGIIETSVWSAPLFLIHSSLNI